MIKKFIFCSLSAFILLSFFCSIAFSDDLPPHKFKNSSKGRAQIRGVISKGEFTKDKIKEISVNLAKLNKSTTGAYLVQFFSSDSCLNGWNGTGLLRDSDWPYWLCRVTVDTNSNGNLFARSFELAVDENTGSKRVDVLKK